MQLRKISYQGFHGFDGQIVYLIMGREVFFSGVTETATSTINAAEEVVRDICSNAGITPWDYTFYDIQTHRGYGGKSIGYYVVDRLHIQRRGAGIHVSDWEEVARWEFPREFDLNATSILQNMDNDRREQMKEYGRQQQAELPGISDEVLRAFRPLIEQ